MTRRGRVISNSTLSCPSCSNAVEATDDSIKCDKCDLWFHQSCSKLPEGSLAILKVDGCFWFCSDFPSIMLNIDRLFNYLVRQNSNFELFSDDMIFDSSFLKKCIAHDDKLLHRPVLHGIKTWIRINLTRQTIPRKKL